MLMVPKSPETAAVPASIRADGGVRVAFGPAPGAAVPLEVAESGGYRVRFPRTGEGVLINTGGGLAGGDRMTVNVAVAASAHAAVTTQAAEKVYRSDGAETEITISLILGPGSRLAWLPQEQIMFDGARLRRRLDVHMAHDGSLILAESLVFGRLAMGETVAAGSFRDRWRIRRDGRLVFAEDVVLGDRIQEVLARPAVANGGRAVATFLHVGPDAERRLEHARSLLQQTSCESGASAFRGMVVARFLSADPLALRTALAGFVAGYRGQPMPRSWQI
jgi:urease accessory protein